MKNVSCTALLSKIIRKYKIATDLGKDRGGCVLAVEEVEACAVGTL